MNQTVFELPPRTSYLAEDFVVTDSNALAHKQITEFAGQPSNVMLLLGPEASGKTHLAHIWAEQQGAVFIAADALSAEDSSEYFAQHSAVVVEDIERCPKDALFHFAQHLKLSPEHKALLSSSKNLAQLWVESPDIHSRLKSWPVALLEEPDDTLLEALLIKGFSDRQLRVDPALITYLLPRIERSCVAVYQLLHQLDHAALQEKRPITLPLARSVLEKTEQE